MSGYSYLDENGSFRISNPELTSYLYFPIANESGVMGSVTPLLGGDNKMGQNTFLLAPVSSEDLHNNKSTRNFWCNIKGKGLWSATGNSAVQEGDLFTDKKEETVLDAGFMWHKMKRVSKVFGITSEITSFVPYTKDTIELMLVKLYNSGEEDITLTPTAAIPMYGRSADNIRDHRHVTSLLHRVETTKFGVVLNPTLTFDERGHHKNSVVYGVFGSSENGEEPVGFYPNVEEFIGEGGSFINPRALAIGEAAPVGKDFSQNGYEALGGISFKEITLKPGEEKTYIISMGYGNKKEELTFVAGSYSTIAVCLKSLEDTKEYWLNKLNVKYKTNSPDFDAFMMWVNFQPMLRRIYGCSFLPHHDYGKGGRGWRDLWQDCLALLMMNPDGVKDMLYDNFGGVRIDGSNATIIGQKQGEFIADRNNITRVWMDHGAWPFLTTRLYIMQTGDLELLLKDHYYFKDLQAVRGDDKDYEWKATDGNRLKAKDGKEYKGTILEHMLIQHLTAFYDVGDHNHMRLRGADWNDALDMAKEHGESVAFTALYGHNLEQLAELLLRLKDKGTTHVSLLKELDGLLNSEESVYDVIKDKQDLLVSYCESCKHNVTGEKLLVACEELAANLSNKAKWIKEHIRKSEWLTNKEGYSWFNGYYDNSGRKVEGDFDLGVRMMLTGQVFAIMSGTATKEQIKEIVKASDAYLYDENVGGYKLNTDFKEIKTDLGRMFGFAYGSKENGAVFSHMAVMYANALYQRNFVNEGYKVIASLYNHLSNFEKSKIYPGIPEYIGDNGRGLYHYLTGSASWLLLTVLTEMFGVKGHYGDLLLEPKLIKEQFDETGSTYVQLEFAGKPIKVIYKNVNNKAFEDYKISSVTLNGSNYGLTGNRALIKREDLEGLKAGETQVIEVELV